MGVPSGRVAPKARHIPAKTEAVAYQIWAAAQRMGWDFTVDVMAGEIGRTEAEVWGAIKAKGWRSRLRASRAEILRASKLDGWHGAKNVDDGDLPQISLEGDDA